MPCRTIFSGQPSLSPRGPLWGRAAAERHRPKVLPAGGWAVETPSTQTVP